MAVLPPCHSLSSPFAQAYTNRHARNRFISISVVIPLPITVAPGWHTSLSHRQSISLPATHRPNPPACPSCSALLSLSPLTPILPPAFPSHQPILHPICPSVPLSPGSSRADTRGPRRISPRLPPPLHIFHLFVSPTHPGPRSLSPILRGGGGKEFAADRCIARRQTHGRPCAGQFLPECPKSHIPSIISGAGKTDGIINESSLIKGGKGACLGCPSPARRRASDVGTALSLPYRSSFVPAQQGTGSSLAQMGSRGVGEGGSVQKGQCFFPGVGL